MKDLSQFIGHYSINEHLIDSAPQMILIIGLPASGKSTFITMHLPKYFPSIKQTRTLDSDIQLHKRQKESAMAFANAIYSQTEDEFNAHKQDVMSTFNSTDAQKMLGFNFNITTDWDWVQKYKHLAVGKFQNQFLKDFFVKDWAVNFAVRPVAIQDMQELTKHKLSPEEFERTEIFNNNDVVIPMTGDNKAKITKLIQDASDKFAVSVVYLDMPMEVSVEKDEGRRKKSGRGVGRELIEMKDEGIKATWDYLSKGGFKKEGIYKLLHFKYVPVPGAWGEYKLHKEYINTKLIKDFMN
jgi:dephospho-CoA kinase